MTQRKHGRIWFDGWSVPDPACNQHEGGRWMSRYSDHRNYSAAEQADAYAYLLVHCPTTELAIAKLREIRRAIRELPNRSAIAGYVGDWTPYSLGDEMEERECRELFYPRKPSRSMVAWFARNADGTFRAGDDPGGAKVRDLPNKEAAREWCDASIARRYPSMTLLERDPVAYYKIHARNVDKQRRRLLALKCNHKARKCDASAVAAQEGDSPYADWCRRHAAKLRTIAARLRGTE